MKQYFNYLLVLFTVVVVMAVFSSLVKENVPDFEPEIQYIEGNRINDSVFVVLESITQSIDVLVNDRYHIDSLYDSRIKEIESLDFDGLYDRLSSLYPQKGDSLYIINENQVNEIVTDKISLDYNLELLRNCRTENILDKQKIDLLTYSNTELDGIISRNKNTIINYQEYIEKQKKKDNYLLVGLGGCVVGLTLIGLLR